MRANDVRLERAAAGVDAATRVGGRIAHLRACVVAVALPVAAVGIATPAFGQRANGQSVSRAVAAEADSVARTAGLPVDLRSAPLTDGDLEIRAFLGLGHAAPERLVRIVRSAGHTTGELALWWPGTALRFDVPDDPERPIAQHDQETWAAAMRQRARALGCGPVKQGGWVETCVLERSAGIDWTRTLAELDSAGLGRLNRLHAEPGGSGTTLYVQMRAGKRFSEYFYSDPQRRASDPAERAAAGLSQLLIRLFESRPAR